MRKGVDGLERSISEKVLKFLRYAWSRCMGLKDWIKF